MVKITKKAVKPTNKATPHFEPGTMVLGPGVSLVADTSGKMYRVDVKNGTISEMSWEK